MMRARSARWALLCIFPIGYLSTSHALGPLPSSFLALSALNTLAMTVLLSRMTSALRQTLWVWVTLGVMLTGVFVKFYWFAWRLNDPFYVSREFPTLRWVTTDRLLSGYASATLGFTIFCLSAAFVLTWPPPTSIASRSQSPRRLLTAATTQLVATLVLVYFALALLQFRLGYGILGVGNPTLPGRLGTLLTFTRQNVTFGLLLLAVWLFDRATPRSAAMTSCFIVVAALIDSLISTSRGSVLYFCAPIVFLWLLTNRVTSRRRLLIGFIALLALAIFPIASAQRLQRIAPGTAVGSSLPGPEELLDSAFRIVTRPSGMEGILFSLDYKGDLSATRVLQLGRRQAMVDYYTRIVTRRLVANDFDAPGLIGGQMILGGSAGIIVLMPLTMIGLGLLWRLLQRLAVWPVALAIAAPQFAVFVSGGVFDFLLLTKLCLVVGCCEFTYRKIATARSVGRTREPHLQHRAMAGA